MMMTQDMNIRKSIRTIILMLALFMGAANGAWALEEENIVFDPVSPSDGGTVALKNIDGQTVTITVTPNEGYYVKVEDIVVQKLQDLGQAQSRRKAPAIADKLTVTALSGLIETAATGDYTFEVPTDYVGALVTVTFTVKGLYTFHIIDMSGHIVVEQSGDFNALKVPDKWKSPLVQTYHYYDINQFISANVSNGVYTLRESVTEIADFENAPNDIYVTYEPSTTYDLDGSEQRAVDGKKYLLKFAGGTSFRQEKDDGFEATAAAGIYPYINGEGGLFVYGQDKLDATTEGVVSTRTRYAWYLEGGDPYRLRISSLQTKTDGVENTHYSYLRTYKPQGYDKVVTGVISNNPTAYDASDDAHAVRHKPTDYMVLNGTNGHFKLVTSDVVDDLDGNAANDVRHTVTSFENYWKTNPTALDALINKAETGNPLQRPDPDLSKEVRASRRSTLGTQINSDGLTSDQKAVFDGLGWHSYNVWANGSTWTESKKFRYGPHWFQTINVGTETGGVYNGDFDLVEYKLDGALILLDQHGWEVMRKPMTTRSSDKDAYKAALRKYDSPMVKMYHFWTNFIKEDGYHKYKPIRGNTNASKNAQHKGEGTSLADYPEVASTGTLDDIYVTYEVMGTYRGRYTGAATQDGTDASNSKYLIRQGTNYAKTTDGSTITAEPVANISDVSTAGEELLWYVKPNFNIDTEMGYNYSGSYEEKTKDETEAAYFANRDDAVYDKTNGQNGFDPYNLQIVSVKYPGKFFKTNATDAVLDGSGGMESTYNTDATVTLGDYGQAFVASDYYNIGTGYQILKVTNSTFMAVGDANGNIRLMPRFDHHNVETSITTLDEQQTAASMGDESGPQTTLFVLPRASISEGTVYSSDEITDMNGNYTLHEAFDVTKVIGTKDNPFKGTIDGQLHTINGVGHPLVAYADGAATIKNVIFKNVTISTGNDDGNAGAICCEAKGTTRIYNCGILPTTTNRDNEGNITGFIGSTVNGSNNVGSIVGLLDGNARVINCFSYANITNGTMVGGIVGNNTTATTQGNSQANFDNNVKTMVVNCMFYGDITGGTTKFPVYGGTAIDNNAEHKVNNYNYYYEGSASYDDAYSGIGDYNYSWPVADKYLTRFEVYRNILNGNRRLCTWWVNGSYNKAPTDEDVETVGIAKWVLDQSIAPYPILKKWGKYPSVVNPDPDRRVDPTSKKWEKRSSSSNWDKHTVPDTEGQILGKLTVNIDAGDMHKKSNDEAITDSKPINITAMDTEYKDYCYGKIQLPYYNEIFGNPEGTTWSEKYGDNYGEYVVTGWEITSTDGSNADGHSFTADWQDGYNCADRKCTSKDLYGTSGRVFAQGGYFYVPDGVTTINIKAHWGKAVYLNNTNSRLDRVNNASNDFYISGTLSFGGTSGILPLWPGSNIIKTTLSDALGQLDVNPTGSVYDQAIVLVGNYQNNAFHSALTLNCNNESDYNSRAKPFTIMSADFDFDNEPDFCFQGGMNGGGRINCQPIRFDFLMVPDLTMAVRSSTNYYGMRIFTPIGHFEITETAYIYTTQFEYDTRGDNNRKKHEAPMILNGGEHMQIVSSEDYTTTNNNATATSRVEKTSYFLMGGNVYMHAFSPGCHGNKNIGTRHCAVNAIGGEYPKFYLSGMFNANFYNKTDNPHAYLDGGKFGLVAGAGMESVGGKDETNGGNVTFIINHSLIDEFYGGGINASRPVTGNINVTIDNSKVKKYCGGPKLGDMSNTKTITTNATGTTFDEYYGGGNGGTNLLRDRKSDSGAGVAAPANDESGHNLWNKAATGNGQEGNYGGFFTAFTPFEYDAAKGYQAEYEFEMLPRTSGDSRVITRSYYHWASFSKTTVAPVTNTIIDCTFNRNFYGGGNLGAVDSPTNSENPAISSTLSGHTIVHGSVFGAGFSASIPSFRVHDKSTVVYPYQDKSGFIHDGSLDHKKYDSDITDPTTGKITHKKGDYIYYKWIHDVPNEWGKSPDPSKNKDLFFEYPVNSGNWYVYTTTNLTGLGAVNGDVSLTITDDTIVEGKVFNEDGTVNPNEMGGVFGGGDESAVKKKTGVADSGNTTVNLQGKTEVYGNVYGGGNRGVVEGNTTVNIRETPPETP